MKNNYCFSISDSTKSLNSHRSIRVLFLIFCFTLIAQISHAQVIASYDFESGLQGWNSNGNNSGLINSLSWTCDGSQSIFSNGNNTNRNIMTSPVIDLSSYSNLSFTFCHKNVRIDDGEGFTLQFYNGSSWQTVKTYRRNIDFLGSGSEYSITFTETLLDSEYNFASNSRFRFSGTANNNNEWNFFDNIEIRNIPPCLNPNNQATALSFNSVTETTMGIAFTGATSSPDNYLVIYNTSGITPSISDGTIYNEGSTFFGNTVLSNDDTTSFNIIGLDEGTTYYFYIFSFNSLCAGGPVYNITSPLSGNQATEVPCSFSDADGNTTLACPSVD